MASSLLKGSRTVMLASFRPLVVFQKTQKLFLGGLGLLLLFGTTVAHCPAQDGQPKGPGSDRRPSDRSLMPLMHDVRKQVFSSRLEFMALLRHSEIRVEIGLDEDKYELLSSSNKNLFMEIKDLFHGDREQRTPESREDSPEAQLENQLEYQQLVTKIAQLIREHDQQFMEQLRGSSNFDRFIEILVQARGHRAVVHEDVANRIGLPPEKLEEVRTVGHQVWREQWETMGDRMRELIRSEETKGPAHQGKRQEARQLVERAESKVNEAVGRRLASEHLEALKQLQGKPFALPEDFFEVRMPPPSGPRGHRGERDDESHRRPRP